MLAMLRNREISRNLAHLDTICRQEEDALEIFELAEENADKSISVNVVHVSLFQEDVCLIKQQDGTPRMADVEDFCSSDSRNASQCPARPPRPYTEGISAAPRCPRR